METMNISSPIKQRSSESVYFEGRYLTKNDSCEQIKNHFLDKLITQDDSGKGTGSIILYDGINFKDLCSYEEKKKLNLLLKENDYDIMISVEKVWTHPFIGYATDLMEYIFRICNKISGMLIFPESRYLAIELFAKGLKQYFNRISKIETDSEVLKEKTQNAATFLTFHCVNLSYKFILGKSVFTMQDITRFIKNVFEIETDKFSMLQFEIEILKDLEFKLHKPTVYTFFMEIVHQANLKEKVDIKTFDYFSTLIMDFVYLNHRRIFDRLYETNDFINSEKIGCIHIENNKVLIATSVILIATIASLGKNTENLETQNILNQITFLTHINENIVKALSNTIIEMIIA